MAKFGLIGLAAAVAAVAFGASASAAHAGWGAEKIWLSCSNGHTYALSPRAVSDDGDLVTGTLRLSPRRALHVRLIPMGVGYRYAGRGVWLDGVRGEAVMHFGKHQAVDCAVSPVVARTTFF